MNYKLAKKLKEAGFPQKGKGENKYEDGTKVPSGAVSSKTYSCYIPTLSELIEACKGELNLYNLSNDLNHWIADHKNPFRTGHGNSLQEAVANLWFQLNEKDKTNTR